MATSSLSFLPAHPLSLLQPHRLHLPNPAVPVPTSIPLSPSPAVRCATTSAAAAGPLPPPKLVRCPALDRQAARANRLRFARKLLTLLLSKPRRFLPLRVLRRCRRFLGLPRHRPLLPFVLRYPTLFRLFQAPTSHPLSPTLSTLAIALTPAAGALATDLASLRGAAFAPRLAAKIHRLLLLTPHRSLQVSKIAHLAPDLGLAMDFRATLCPRHPDLFTFVHTSHGHALQLADPPPPPPPPIPPLRPAVAPDRLIDRPPRFPHLPLRRGLNLRRAHRDYLLRFHSLPEVSPFEPLDEGASVEMVERRACAVVREVLAMTVEKRTLVDHLTHFRRDFGLPNRLRTMLVRHPELFYVSVKGVRHSVFLVEAFDDDGRLLVEDEMLVGRDRLEELVREGKQIRRARRKGVLAVGDNSDEDGDDEEEEEGLLEVDGEFATSPSPPPPPRTHTTDPTPRDMAAHSVAAAHATIAARAGSAPGGGAAAPSERLGFRLSSLAGRGLRSPLPPRRAPSASRRQRVRAATVETLEGQVATGALLEKSVNTIRFLAIDAVEKANSGHPGLPMGCAPMGHILYDEVMRYNPKNPYWFNRDRFVLSAGHGCMLQYALLHLAGYDAVQEEDLKQFRQWGSRTPGHPENFETPGVEVTTGPLGQGIANAVGLALAEKHLAARFNKPDSEIVDHYTYCILGDGCQMEGISNEACSLAGHWGLGKLIAFYDDNHISIDGDTDIAFTEDVSARFEALGWHTIWVKNGNTGYDEIRAAIKEAKAVTNKPTLIKVTTTIGFGSPNKSNSYSVHGSALGTKEVEATRQNLSWPYEPFFVPEDVKSHWSRHVPQGAALEADWSAKFAEYEKKYPEDAATLKSIVSGELPAGWADALPKYTPESPADATRNLSQQCLNALAKVVPGLLGGSADLASSNMTLLKMFGDFQKDTPEERNVRFGVREHGMGAICNGIALHSPGLIPYCATFFVFTDYMRAAMRISALCEDGVIYVMTHDSIGLGEDGPTHQPIEHLLSFRAMPNILMFRPADGNETAGAYKIAVLNRKRPSVLALSRQKLPHLPGTSIEGVEKGGYTISDNSTGNKPDLIVMSTGSELEIAAKAADELRKEGKTVRVVSFVCWELFEEQSDVYKESVLPEAVTARISIEAGSTLGWQKYIGAKGKTIGIDKFGASAPAGKSYKEYGITAENVIAAAKSL